MFSTLEDTNAYVPMSIILGRKYNFIVDTGIGGGCVDAMLEYIGENSKPIIVISTHHGSF